MRLPFKEFEVEGPCPPVGQHYGVTKMDISEDSNHKEVALLSSKWFK